MLSVYKFVYILTFLPAAFFKVLLPLNTLSTCLGAEESCITKLQVMSGNKLTVLIAFGNQYISSNQGTGEAFTPSESDDDGISIPPPRKLYDFILMSLGSFHASYQLASPER